MRIIVVGIGGVGGYFGGRITQTGHQVEFVARGDHGKRIAADGLQVKSITGDFRARPDKVHNSIATVSDPDLVLVCTKSWQLVDVAKALKGRIHSSTRILPLQNGVNSVEKLTKYLPEKQIFGGLCRIISKIEAPGVIHHFAFHPQVVFGETDGSTSEEALLIRDLFRHAGIDAVLSTDIRLEIWRKFLFICVLSGMGAITRQPIGVMRDDPGIRELMTASAKEVVMLAQAKGVALSEDDIEQTFRVIDRQEHGSTASMQRDLMEGRPSELHDFNGYVVGEGSQLGLHTPVNKFIYYTLRPMEAKARAFYE